MCPEDPFPLTLIRCDRVRERMLASMSNCFTGARSDTSSLVTQTSHSRTYGSVASYSGWPAPPAMSCRRPRRVRHLVWTRGSPTARRNAYGGYSLGRLAPQGS
jgi:hypothetical protein